jgi:hypothetical protein
MDKQFLVLIVSAASGIITILLGVIGYFLRGVHTELHKVSEAVVAMTTKIAVTEEKGRSGHQILQSRIASVEKRIEKIESKIYA